MTSIDISYTIFKNAENNRVWVYWFRDKPEFIPGYWNLDTEGLENTTAQEWAKNANEWVRAMAALGCSYKEIGAAIGHMMDGLGFKLLEEFINDKLAVSIA